MQLATGTYTTWIADDAPFHEGAIDSIFDILLRGPYFEKNVITGKYYEGRQVPGSDELHLSDKYYHLNYHDPTRSPYYPDNWFIFNMGIISTNYLKSLGGWDCSFETTAVADADLAVRIQRDGAVVALTPECIATVEWNPGISGDHGPVHYACIEHDFPLFQSIYTDANCVNRIKIPIDNWITSPSYWSRRSPPLFIPTLKPVTVVARTSGTVGTVKRQSRYEKRDRSRWNINRVRR